MENSELISETNLSRKVSWSKEFVYSMTLHGTCISAYVQRSMHIGFFQYWVYCIISVCMGTSNYLYICVSSYTVLCSDFNVLTIYIPYMFPKHMLAYLQWSRPVKLASLQQTLTFMFFCIIYYSALIYGMHMYDSQLPDIMKIKVIG